jgi:hypothetical protein
VEDARAAEAIKAVDDLEQAGAAARRRQLVLRQRVDGGEDGRGGGDALDFVGDRPLRRTPSRFLARWTLLGALGDIGTPARLALVVALGLSYRAAFVIAGVLVLMNAWAVWRSPEPPRARQLDDEERGTLWDALKNRRLVLRELACVFCSFLDERAGLLLVGPEPAKVRAAPAARISSGHLMRRKNVSLSSSVTAP